jgi:transposase
MTGWTPRRCDFTGRVCFCIVASSFATRPLSECSAEEFWRGQLGMLVRSLEHAFAQEQELDRKLDELAKASEHIQRLMTIPGVGRCTAEVICAWIDNPRRFHNGREVSSYAGLVPLQYQSEAMSQGCGECF